MWRLLILLLAAAFGLASCAPSQRPAVKPVPDVEMGPGGEVMPYLETPRILIEDPSG